MLNALSFAAVTLQFLFLGIGVFHARSRPQCKNAQERVAFYLRASLVACVVFYGSAGVAHADSWPAAGLKYYCYTGGGATTNRATADEAKADCDALLPGAPTACWLYYPGDTFGLGPTMKGGHQRMNPLSSCATSPFGSSSTYNFVVEVWHCGAGTLDFTFPSLPTCQNTVCAANSGKVVDYDFTVSGNVDYPPTGRTICIDSCEMTVIQGTRDVFEFPSVPSEPARTIFTGTGRITGGACNASAPIGRRTTTFRDDVNTPSGAIAGTASTGVGGGAGQADSINANMARTATNTQRILEALKTGGTGGGGGSSTAPAATSASGCGRPGQPDCAVTLDEGGTASSHASAIGATNADIDAMEATMEGTRNAMKLDGAPKFTNSDGSGRWSFDWMPFFASSGAAECKLESNFKLAGAMVPAGIDFCGIGPYINAILYWAVGLFTALSLWNTVYRIND